MKIKFIICLLLLYQSLANSQESKKRPPWTNAMPEKNVAPAMKVEIEKSEGFEVHRSSFDFDENTELQSEELNEKTQIKKSIEVAQKVETQRIEMQGIEIQKLEIQIDKSTNIKLKYPWRKIKSVTPKFPIKAAKIKLSGWVDVKIVVNKNGEIVESKVVKSENGTRYFNQSALKAVGQWRYEPPTNYGITKNQTKVIRLIYEL